MDTPSLTHRSAASRARRKLSYRGGLSQCDTGARSPSREPETRASNHRERCPRAARSGGWTDPHPPPRQALAHPGPSSAGIMPTLWMVLALGLAACVSGQTSVDTTSDKDLYIVSSGAYPIDDDDYSGSGSGAFGVDDEDEEILITSRIFPNIPPTSDAPKETTTLKTQSKIPAQTKGPDEIDQVTVPKSNSDNKKRQFEKVEDVDVHTQKHSEGFFHKTEVLAAVIAGGVIGFLFAIFLILLLVYRMRKKDEGSYDLGERKPSSAAYQKAPTKEFYA